MTHIKTMPAVLMALALMPSLAQAQTLATPSSRTAPAGVRPVPGAHPVPGVRLVPQSVVDQAKDQAQGNFTTMKRATVGGQVQEVWDQATNTNGVFRFQYCKHCTYKARLREHMVTVIELPSGETIDKADVGDRATFQVQIRDPNRLAIRPTGFGIDTNLIVYGKSGAIYPIYLRAESFNSVNIPDLLVRIEGTISNKKPGSNLIDQKDKTPPSGDGEAKAPPLQIDAVAGLKSPDFARAEGEFVQEVPFDPDTLRGWGDYKLWSGGSGGADLKPETVFRDDYFTYIRFGEAWKDIELPTAYVVIDGIDELVNTRIQGRTYIIESTQRLITLKSGESFLCIEYAGEL
jgi:ComB9 competence protein